MMKWMMLILSVALPAACTSSPPPQNSSLGNFGPAGFGVGSPVQGGFSATGNFHPVPAMPALSNNLSGGMHGASPLPGNMRGFSGQ